MAHQVTVAISSGGRKKVMLATPTYDGQVCQSYVASLAQSMLLLADAGIGVTYSNLAGDCHVDDARNALLREFMRSDCEELIFLDADVGWRPDDLVALALHEKDVIAGVYPKKWKLEEEYPVFVLPGSVLQADENGLVEVAGVPTGFLKITRSALEKIHEAYGDRKYCGQGQDPSEPPYTIIFERLYEDGHRWSGDYAFCKKWRDIGGKIYVDPEMHFVHEGNKIWGGSLGEYWREKHGVNQAIRDQKCVEAISKIKDGTCDLGDMDALFKNWGNVFAAAPDLCFAVHLMAKEAQGPILECGSGLTTLVMALSTDQPIHVLEHSPVWAQYVENKLNQYGIKNVTIHCQPMKDHGDNEWYDFPSDLPEFDLVLVDGPPRCVNNKPLKGGRAGVLLLSDKIKNAQFIFDDAGNGHGLDMDKIKNELGLDLKVIDGLRSFAASVRKYATTN